MATYVLVHGAYQGGWIWKPVAERLRAAGHTSSTRRRSTAAPSARTRCAPASRSRTHAQEIAQFLFYEDLARRGAGRHQLGRHGDREGRRAGARPHRAGSSSSTRSRCLPGERVGDDREAPGGHTVSTTLDDGPDARGRREAGCSRISTRTCGPGRSRATRRIPWPRSRRRWRRRRSGIRSGRPRRRSAAAAPSIRRRRTSGARPSG